MKTKEKVKTKVIMICEYNSHAPLTIGKEYEILEEEDGKIFVINDNGKKQSYYKSRFKKKI